MSEYVWVSGTTYVEYRVNLLPNNRQIHTVRVDGVLVASDTQPILLVEGQA